MLKKPIISISSKKQLKWEDMISFVSNKNQRFICIDYWSILFKLKKNIEI